MDTREPETVDERTLFIKALTSRLKMKRDYELVQAWMNVFLRLHGDDLLTSLRSSTQPPASVLQLQGNGQENDSGDAMGVYAGSGVGSEGINGRGGGGDVLGALKKWKQEQEKEAKRLAALTGYCSGVLRYLRRTT